MGLRNIILLVVKKKKKNADRQICTYSVYHPSESDLEIDELSFDCLLLKLLTV